MNVMKRYPEIDLLRTIAIIMMIAFHAAFDLEHFYGWDLDVFQGGWLVLGRATATLFLGISGVSAAVSHIRMKEREFSPSRIRIHTAKRGANILLAALLVSVGTYIVDPATFVRFGILHLIGTGVLLLPFFAPLGAWTIVPGIALLLLGTVIRGVLPASSLLLPLGSPPPGFSSVDYYPLIPWFWIMLVGFGIGYLLYARNAAWRNNRLCHALEAGSRRQTILTFPGRHSLLLYLAHQPVILGILWLLLGTPRL